MNIFNKIVATSLKYRYLVVFLAAVFMILGIGLIRILGGGRIFGDDTLRTGSRRYTRTRRDAIQIR
jgi:hypothetical protein